MRRRTGQRESRQSTYFRRETHLLSTSPTPAPSFAAPVLRNRVANLPPLQSPHWRAPGGTRDPDGQPQRVCSDDIQEAALRGDLGLVRRLAQAGASVNAPLRAMGEEEYMTLPHVLACKPEIPNGTRILAEIVESMANPNVRSSLGTTPLMFACLHKNVGSVEVLLGCGANTEPVDDHGRTAVRCCMVLAPERPRSAELSVEIAQLLAAASADLDDGGSRPPITEAVLQLNHLGVTTLLELGAMPDGLHEAVTHAPLTLIKMLIEKESNPFLRDEEGKTVMEKALARGDDDITTVLRDYIGNLERSQHAHLAFRKLGHEDAFEANRLKRDPRGNTDGDERDILGEWSKRRGKVQQFARYIYNGVRFQIFMFAVLLLALFLPDLWVITSSTNIEALDGILLAIFVIFFIEFVLQLIGEWKTYKLGFAFWMDIVGIISVPLEHSFVTNLMMSNVELEGATLARATKIVKLGVRSIRFSRLVKLIRFLPDSGQGAVGSTAKKMAGILGRKVSTQVSCLVIITVIVLPTVEFFMFPEDDYSMQAWSALIFRAARDHAADLAPLVVAFEEFYRELAYFPYEVRFTFSNGSVSVLNMSGQIPPREQDRYQVEQKGEDGVSQAQILFNFTDPRRTESICNCLLITAIILIMFSGASLVTHSVSRIVLVPLERLLSVVQSIAGQIFSSVKKIVRGADEDEDDRRSRRSATDFEDETKLIAKVLKKLTALSEITARRMPIDDFEQLDEDHRALLQDFTAGHSGLVPAVQEIVSSAAEQMELGFDRMEEQGLSRESLERWDFNVADLTEPQRFALCSWLLLMSGGPAVHGTCSAGTLIGMEFITRCQGFVETTRQGYASPENVKYHNWLHAADVTFTMFRCLRMVKAEHFIGVHERFAMMVAALAHDIGHPGYNNAFLIETSHELAIRYNDSSPLENMHSARLFQILGNPSTNVFINLQGLSYREVRHVCIECILATDNQRHYTLLSELQVTADSEAELFDAVADCYNSNPGEYPPSEAIDFYCTPDMRKLIRAFFLHFADISNAMKPWRLCKYWAELVFEEFFTQGDSEKAMGIPVQPLNDRDKVNKPQVQLGFSELFVLPLASAVARLMPPLRPCKDTVFDNLDKWTRRWMETEQGHEDHGVVHRISRLRSGQPQSQVTPQVMPSPSGRLY